MSRQPKIRIRSRDKELIQKLNKSVNQKQRRLDREYGVNAGVEVKKIGDFSTRKEFNKYVQDMQKFTDRKSHRYVKNMHGLVLPREVYTEAKKEEKRVNREKDKEYNKIKKKGITDRGRPTTKTVEGQRYGMGSNRYQRFNHIKFDFDNFKEMGDLKEFLKRLENYKGDFNSRVDTLYRDNYIKALQRQLPGDSEHIQAVVEKMNKKEFLELYYTEKFADIRFIYEKHAKDAKIATLEKVFNIVRE